MCLRKWAILCLLFLFYLSQCKSDNWFVGLFKDIFGMYPAQKTHNLEDFTTRRDKEKLMILARELLLDSKLQYRQLKVVREQYNFFLSYEVGLVIGKIRERYKRMMEVYREFTLKVKYGLKNDPNYLYPPSIARHFRSLHFLVHMETVRALEMEIDKLVHVLETIPEKVINDRNAMPAMGEMLTEFADGGFPAPDGFNNPEALSAFKEGVLPPPFAPPGSNVGGPRDPESMGPPDENPNLKIPNHKDPNIDNSDEDYTYVYPKPLPHPGFHPDRGPTINATDNLEIPDSVSHPKTSEDVKAAYRKQYYAKRRGEHWTLGD